MGESISNSEINRLIGQGAVKLDGEVLADKDLKVSIPKDGVILKVGKRQWFKVSL